jgi:signal transduction histidine kinase
MPWLEAANRLETVALQLSSVVHEVNNMLQIVSGSAEMLLMAADAPPAVLRRADVIGAQAQRAAALLADVLALSREAPDAARLDLRDLATRVIAMRRYAISKARVLERVDLCAEDAVVQADGRRLVQIALNLVMRAERAVAGRTDAFVRVAVVREGPRAVLVVEDNGRPTAEDDLVQMSFDPADEAAGLPGALNIGVHVAAWLAAQEGGQLALTSKPSGGTIATLSMPVV